MVLDLFSILSRVPLVGNLFTNNSVERNTEYFTNYSIPNLTVQPTQIVDLHRRGAISKDTYYQVMRYFGYEQHQAKLFYFGQDATLTAEQAVLIRISNALALTYNYEVNPSQTISEANALARNEELYHRFTKRLGYRRTESARLFEANRAMPTFSTILDWMAKEVFEPDAIEQFELDAEQPPQLAQYMAHYGVPAEEARKYWIAHWIPIGYGRWDELYQRFRSVPGGDSGRDSDFNADELAEVGLTFDDVKITDEEYRRYFTVLEHSPYFRRRLQGANYRPMPFSILQVLFQYGVLDQNTVIGRLRDYGYSKTSAGLIAKAWSLKFPYGAKEPKLQNLTYQFANRLMDEAAFRAAMSEFVDSDTIEFYVNKINNDISEKRVTYKIRGLTARYGRNAISDSQLDAELLRLLPGDENSERRMFEKENIKAIVEKNATRLSTRAVGRAFEDGKVNDAEFTAYLTSLRMTAMDIELAKKVYAGASAPPPGG